ncbi:hypothetical protein GG344DRAFT_75375 [Lentinula edodes]|nr:hypothetical protein GG344DRAFT_75375 [Lentinula edodes]
MSSSESRVTFGNVPGGPSRRFGPLHRSTRPARSIMRRSKMHVHHLALGRVDQVHSNFSLNRGPQDISNTRQHPTRPSSTRKANSLAPHVHYVGSRRQGVFAFSPSITPSSRCSSSHHKRHSSTSSDSSRSHSRHHRSVSHSGRSATSTSHSHGHKRAYSDFTSSRNALESESHGHSHRSKLISNSHKRGHRRRSSGDPFVLVPTHSHGIQISPPQHLGSVQTNESFSRAFVSPLHHSGSPFNLQSLGYSLPLTPYAVHSPFHPTPHNSYADSTYLSSMAESDLWTHSTSSVMPPQSERVHLHSELIYGTGHMLQWNMILPPQTTISGFSNPSSNIAIYSGVSALDSATQDLLHSPACPGAAKIIIRHGKNNQALGLWMEKWGPLEVYPSSLTFENEITVFEVLHAVYSYFQVRLSSQATAEMPMESQQRITLARAKRVTFEDQMADKAEWNRPPKRVDVLALWCVFGGFDVRYNNGDGYTKLDEPGWRVVELEMRLRSV